MILHIFFNVILYILYRWIVTILQCFLIINKIILPYLNIEALSNFNIVLISFLILYVLCYIVDRKEDEFYATKWLCRIAIDVVFFQIIFILIYLNG